MVARDVEALEVLELLHEESPGQTARIEVRGQAAQGALARVDDLELDDLAVGVALEFHDPLAGPAGPRIHGEQPHVEGRVEVHAEELGRGVVARVVEVLAPITHTADGERRAAFELGARRGDASRSAALDGFVYLPEVDAGVWDVLFSARPLVDPIGDPEDGTEGRDAVLVLLSPEPTLELVGLLGRIEHPRVAVRQAEPPLDVGRDVRTRVVDLELGADAPLEAQLAEVDERDLGLAVGLLGPGESVVGTEGEDGNLQSAVVRGRAGVDIAVVRTKCVVWVGDVGPVRAIAAGDDAEDPLDHGPTDSRTRGHDQQDHCHHESQNPDVFGSGLAPFRNPHGPDASKAGVISLGSAGPSCALGPSWAPRIPLFTGPLPGGCWTGLQPSHRENAHEEPDTQRVGTTNRQALSAHPQGAHVHGGGLHYEAVAVQLARQVLGARRLQDSPAPRTSRRSSHVDITDPPRTARTTAPATPG